MIEFNYFIKEVNKKFQDEIWADHESKFFRNNLFIKCGIDLSYSHQFELYIEDACIDTFITEWTVDLRKNKIIQFKKNELFFITDNNETIKIKGKKYFVNLSTTIYHSNPTSELTDYIINPSLLDLSTISDIKINNYFIELKL